MAYCLATLNSESSMLVVNPHVGVLPAPVNRELEASDAIHAPLESGAPDTSSSPPLARKRVARRSIPPNRTLAGARPGRAPNPRPRTTWVILRLNARRRGKMPMALLATSPIPKLENSPIHRSSFRLDTPHRLPLGAPACKQIRYNGQLRMNLR